MILGMETKRIVLPILFSIIIMTGGIGAFAHGNVDQSSFGSQTGNFAINSPPFSGQTFTPSVNSITGVDVGLLNTDPLSGDIILRIHNGINVLAPVIGVSTSHSAFPSMGRGDVHFHFAGPVAVTPGNTYFISLELTDTNDFLSIHWDTDDTDPYAGGDSHITGTDLLFRTYFESAVVGGELLPIDTTALLIAGAQMNAAWMIPVIVSAIGIGIVIARKF